MGSRLDKRIAVVTGAASGIGRAAAERLSRDGFAVALLDSGSDNLHAVAKVIQAAGGESFPQVVDVSSDREVTQAFQEVSTRLGIPKVLVNSAGILKLAPALDLQAEDWRRVLEVNLTGTFLCSQAAARLMVEGKTGGRIINVASVHAQAPGRNLAHYDASKGGMWMLTRSLALEWASHQIAVNAVGPGLVLTNSGGGTDAAYLAEVIPSIPFGRAGTPEDIAGTISFLSSDDAAYITGAMIFVDGGMLLTAHT